MELLAFLVELSQQTFLLSQAAVEHRITHQAAAAQVDSFIIQLNL
jgi:hypothetical protein